MRKRIDIEPTLKEVDKAIVEDLVGRGESLKEFIRLLYEIEGNYSIFLDGEWGSGKTFFVKEIERLLTVLDDNFSKEVSSEVIQAASDMLKYTDPINNHFPIYFNAWEYDYCDNPILSLMEVVITEFLELENKAEDRKTIGKKAADLLKAVTATVGIGNCAIEVDLEKVVEALEKSSPLDELRRKKIIREKLKGFLDAAKHERANRIVLFVDELDRCRPEYAIKVLEALKSLFDQEYLTVVFSVNSKALGMSISSWYGDGFSGPRYLMRFYDLVFQMPHHDSTAYLRSLGILGYPGDFLVRCVERRDVTIRDNNRFRDELIRATESTQYKYSDNNVAAAVCLKGISIGAIVFGELHPDKKNHIFSGKNWEDLYGWMKEDEIFLEDILALSGKFFGDSENEPPDHVLIERNSFSDEELIQAEARFQKLYSLIFGQEKLYVLEEINKIRVSELRKGARNALGLQ